MLEENPSRTPVEWCAVNASTDAALDFDGVRVVGKFPAKLANRGLSLSRPPLASDRPGGFVR